MRRMRVLVAVAVALVAIGGSGTGYLYLELGQTNASLKETLGRNAALDAQALALDTQAQSLRETIARLGTEKGTLQAEKDDLITAIARLGTEKGTLQAEKDDLITAKATLETSLTGAQTTNETLTGDLAAAIALQDGLRTELGDANTQVASLSVEKTGLESQLSALGEQHAALGTRHQELGESHEEVTALYKDLGIEHTRLRQATGSVEELDAQARDLRSEIARLEERRRPLILAREAGGGFRCTGSMEPKLTCLDTATWLYDFQPEEVVVGATISFESRACRSDEPSDRRTAHRVMDIRVVDGVYHYWPQGDASSRPDGCWVPHTAVNGYIIEIHKNTRPENATLRNNVNAARNAYLAEKDAYLDLRQFYGCYDIEARCVVYSDAAYNALALARQRAARAWDYYDCWYRNAKTSEYPGHIPHTC